MKFEFFKIDFFDCALPLYTAPEEDKKVPERMNNKTKGEMNK